MDRRYGSVCRVWTPAKQQIHRTGSLRPTTRQDIRYPHRVYDELGGAPERSTPGEAPINTAIDTGWVRVADPLDYTNPTVATVMDDVRGYIARASNRDEDIIEKADTALAGVAVQLLDGDTVVHVYLVTTDTHAGEGSVAAVEAAGFDGQIEVVDGFDLIEEITSC